MSHVTSYCDIFITSFLSHCTTSYCNILIMSFLSHCTTSNCDILMMSFLHNSGTSHYEFRRTNDVILLPIFFILYVNLRIYTLHLKTNLGHTCLYIYIISYVCMYVCIYISLHTHIHMYRACRHPESCNLLSSSNQR